MIDRIALLSDLQSLLKRLEADLLERSDSDDVPEVREWLLREYQQAKDSERTAHTLKQWVDGYITQVAAAWVLSAVFARFLEDNGLVDPPRLSGPQDVDNPASSRLSRARDEHELYFGQHPNHSDRDYLLDVFAGLAKLPATADVFGEHNPLNTLLNWLGPYAVRDLLAFFQKIDAGTGQLVHDFTDPLQEDGSGWDTRFLGDLYQDLSEAARKKYALLQTPDFVEEFILDRTLEPALDEFGLVIGHSSLVIGEERPNDQGPMTNDHFKMIDPACGSGHFLLGSFPRILRRWQQQEPGTNVRVLVQRTLDSIHGVDINPFAIAIARFRLLLAALAACGVKRLADAPAFAMNLACGDSLYHGVERQQTLGDWTDESHYFRTEDAENLRRILQEGTFHAVVANPPYITPKDRAANQVYRRLYPKSCHMKYSLAVPFMERIFRLAVCGGVHHGDTESTEKARKGPAGFTGQITANSFMKREFGKKLIESFFPTMDLTHVIDTSGAYIPGHGTPTVILFARNRKPVSDTIRTVMGIQGEPSTPDDPSRGFVWSAVVEQIDRPGSESEFISAGDSSRELFHKHPWSIGGGGASELKEFLEGCAVRTLDSATESIGVGVVTLEDDVFATDECDLRRNLIDKNYHQGFVEGDRIRDWAMLDHAVAIFPYNSSSLEPELGESLARRLWPFRVGLARRLMFKQTQIDRGFTWYEYGMFIRDKFRRPLSIAFAFVATHNHFVLDRGGKVFKQSAPIIKLPSTASERDHFVLLGLLNSSTGCYWMKQVFYPKATSTGDISTVKGKPEANRYEFGSTGLAKFPIPFDANSIAGERIGEIAAILDAAVRKLHELRPSSVISRWSQQSTLKLRSSLRSAECEHTQLQKRVIALQEELDWAVYNAFGLCKTGAEGALVADDSFGIVGTLRPFLWKDELVPSDCPGECAAIYSSRRDLIRANSQVRLIEDSVFKRLWLGRQGVYGRLARDYDGWQADALASWLIDRLESFFDFDGRMNDEGKATAQIDISLISVAKLADVARQDEPFMEVAEVYRDDPAFDVQKLVEELVKGEHVPLLPVLRYKPNGLRNRAEWEKTWELQRLEDKLRAGEDVRLSDYELTDQQRDDIAGWQQSTPENQRADDRALDAILSIPVPPKYKSSDFISSGGARYWALRGKLDVPKERWVSFPHAQAEDGSLMICWAGYDHLQQATAISAWYVRVRDELGGKEDSRLIPLLAGLIELLPWLKQWHNDIDPTFGMAMGDYFAGFVQEEARALNLTQAEIQAWQPPKTTKKKATRKKSTRRKTAKQQAD